MPEVQVVLVNPLYAGNVGSVARVMKNFGLARLALVDPCPLGDEALAMASHARDLLESAVTTDLDRVFAGSALTVATTGEVAQSVCSPMRMPYFSPRELRGILADVEGTVSILFGRENRGLSNDEVRRAGVVCTIPTSPSYPILNLSHAVGIVCYELAGIPRGTYALASPAEMESLYAHLDRFLDRVEHPPHKREITLLLARRVLSRAKLTIREASTLHGLLRRTERLLDGPAPRNDDDAGPPSVVR
ncbi:MAG: RNA methyltransferase [Methanospirillum sp.]|nr:RNA methyltransferase [Methanospirillum sp.]